MRRNHDYRELPRRNRMSPENRALYERRMAEIKAEERRKHPELLNLKFDQNRELYERRMAEIRAEERRKHPELLKLKFRRDNRSD
jgi:hypothetical protein